jgi:hypothetical protein
MPKHFVWGAWRSDEELQQIALEMNQLHRKLENLVRGSEQAVQIIDQARRENPRNLAF